MLIETIIQFFTARVHFVAVIPRKPKFKIEKPIWVIFYVTIIMANSIKVFTPAEYLAAINADSAGFLLIEKKKEEKVYKGTRFLNAWFNVGASKRSNGWFQIEDVLIPMGIADPADKTDKRNEFEGTRLQFASTVSKAGTFGQLLSKLQPEYRKQIDALVAAGTINLAGKTVRDIITVVHGPNSKNAGQPIEDPYISLKIDFDPYPATFKPAFLAGLPRTQILDWRTRTVDANGVEQFQPAKVMNEAGVEELVNDKNLHKFVTPGSIIRRGRVNIPSVTVFKDGISMPINAARMIIEPGNAAKFSDDAPVNAAALKTALAPAVAVAVVPAAVAVPAAPAAPVPTAVAVPAAPVPAVAVAATDDITAALNAI